MVKKFAVGLIVLPAVALVVEVTFAEPCPIGTRSGDFNGDWFVNMLDLPIQDNSSRVDTGS